MAADVGGDVGGREHLMEPEVVDAHVHVASLRGLRLRPEQWLAGFDAGKLEGLYDAAGNARPEVFTEYLDREGVRLALLFCEHSPRVTGCQPIEDYVAFLEAEPDRYRVVGNVNPHVHYPVVTELRRQRDLGAIACKLHPVHGGFPLDLAELYPLYAFCEEEGLPVVVHAGTSNFPGAQNRYASLDHLVDVVSDFPGCRFVLAHGGRGWAHDQAAFLALTYPNVWIDIAGLPPRRLSAYFHRHNLSRLAERWIFGSDWPGVPGIAANVEGVKALGLGEELTAAVLAGNARAVFKL